MIMIAAGALAAGCALPGATDSADTGRTSLIAESEVKKEPVEEIDEGKAFDSWYKDDEPGIVQGLDVDKYVGDVDTSGLSVKKEDVQASDETIKSQEAYLLNTYAEESDDKSLEAKSGERVIISYDCTVDGKTLDEYSGKSMSITIGENYMPEEFEKKIIGMHPGDTRNVTVDYGSDADNDLKGKTAIYAVTMEKVCVPGEFTDDFVKEHLPYKSVKEFEKAYKEQYKNQVINQKILDMIGELSGTIKEYPEDYLKAYETILTGFDRISYKENLKVNQKTESEYSFDDYTKDIYGDGYDKTIETYAKGYVGQHLACMKIAKSMGLTFTKEDYEKAVKSGQVSDDAVERYGKGYVGSVLYDRYVMTELAKKIKIVS